MANKSAGKKSSKTRTVPEGTSGYEARQGDRSDTACPQAQGLTLTLEFCGFLQSWHNSNTLLAANPLIAPAPKFSSLPRHLMVA